MANERSAVTSAGFPACSAVTSGEANSLAASGSTSGGRETHRCREAVSGLGSVPGMLFQSPFQTREGAETGGFETGCEPFTFVAVIGAPRQRSSNLIVVPVLALSITPPGD